MKMSNENVRKLFSTKLKDDYSLVSTWSNGDGTFSSEILVPSKIEREKFIIKMAYTTPFQSSELMKCLSMLIDLADLTTTWEKQKKGFRAAVELSQATMKPLSEVIYMINKVSKKKLTWFQVIKLKVKNLVIKLKNFFKGFLKQ